MFGRVKDDMSKQRRGVTPFGLVPIPRDGPRRRALDAFAPGASWWHRLRQDVPLARPAGVCYR